MLRRDPAGALQLNEEGLALLQQGRLADAEAKLRRAADLDPYCGAVQNNLGIALLREGRFYESGWALKQACALMPKCASPWTNLGILYESVGKYGPAEEHLRQALQLAPEDVEIIGQLARVHVRQGRHDHNTLVWLQTIATQDDDSAWRSWARAQLIRNQSRESEPRR